jgi:hypothetical protein
MKRRYQIDQQRAVQQFRQLAREENPSIQMIFPMADVVGLLQEGVGHLLREAGLALMNLVMEEEVRHLAGERHQQHAERRAHRWGKEHAVVKLRARRVAVGSGAESFHGSLPQRRFVAIRSKYGLR